MQRHLLQQQLEGIQEHVLLSTSDRHLGLFQGLLQQVSPSIHASGHLLDEAQEGNSIQEVEFMQVLCVCVCVRVYCMLVKKSPYFRTATCQ